MNHIYIPQATLNKWTLCSFFACCGLALSGSGTLFGQHLPSKLPIARPSKSPLFPVYVLDVPSTHQPFSVSLNGWLIDSSEGGEQAYFSSSKIGQYVADGTNTLTIHVLPSAPSNPVPNRFQVRIRSTEGEVFYYDWDPNAPTHPLPFTVKQKVHCPLSQVWPRLPAYRESPSPFCLR